MKTTRLKVGKYTITGVIAKGGMGKIYKAVHPTLGREIILKRLTLRGNSTITERFKREAQLMMDFREERIVQVYDHFKEGASYYIAMEFVDGVSLAGLIEKKRYLSQDIALIIFCEVCKALKYAHDKKVIHRDIKPENILISRNGEVKLTDFGIATSNETHSEDLTRNMILGTPAYMSPEQISNSSKVDKRSDIYSMGVLLYKMVTGRCPFPMTMDPETISIINSGKYQSPRKLIPNISPFVERLIKKAMHRSADSRFTDLEEIIHRVNFHIKSTDQETNRILLQTYIFSSKSDARIKRSKTKVKTVSHQKLVNLGFAGTALAATVAIFLLVLLFKFGFWYDLFKEDSYGRLKIEVSDTQGAIHYLHGEICHYDTEGNIVYDRKNVEFTGTADGCYSSKRISLPSKNYTIRLVANNSDFTKNIILDTTRVNREKNKTDTCNLIRFDYTPVPDKRFSLHYDLIDITTDESIGEADEIYIRSGKSWRRVVQGETLVSGKKYSLMCRKKGYTKYNTTFTADAHLDTVRLALALTPIAGTLTVNPGAERVKLRLNNSSTYYDLKKGSYTRIPDTGSRPLSFSLAPGVYYLMSEHKGEKEISEIAIAPRKEVTIRVGMDKSEGKLTQNNKINGGKQ